MKSAMSKPTSSRVLTFLHIADYLGVPGSKVDGLGFVCLSVCLFACLGFLCMSVDVLQDMGNLGRWRYRHFQAPPELLRRQ